jgi:15-cis-phytoene synthase
METAADRVTRQSHTSFDYAFRILPAEKRRAIHALYSFCRVVDDCADEVGGEGAAGLDRWLEEVGLCYAGQPATDIGRDLTRALARFPIPRAALEEIVAGCRMDLTTSRYPTLADLTVYCRRVASAVGLATIEIFGYTNPKTRDYAVELGLALQLTNILRDVGGDAVQGRIYLPLEDLSRFGVSEGALLAAAKGSGPRPDGLNALLAFEAGRAREHYGRAHDLLPAEDRRSMVSAEVMGKIYRAILEGVAREGFPLDRRIGLSQARKAWIALRTVVRGTLA